jgi:hypothetical protein
MSLFDAFSLRELVSTSLENALGTNRQVASAKSENICPTPNIRRAPPALEMSPKVSRPATNGNVKRQFRGIPRTRRLSIRAPDSSAVSFMTSSRDGASRIMRLRCSGLGSVIWARSLIRRSASIRVCVQP